MNKILAQFILPVFFAVSANAQKSAKSIYLEIGGPGVFSINYDMRFNKLEDKWGFRAGVGGFAVSYFDGQSESITTFPLAVNYLMGEKKHFLEMAAGVTFAKAKLSIEDTDSKFVGTLGHVHVGYRLQPVNKGVIFRVGYTPIFGKGGALFAYGSLSVGYKFH